jgi:hypothetical protein
MIDWYVCINNLFLGLRMKEKYYIATIGYCIAAMAIMIILASIFKL